MTLLVLVRTDPAAGLELALLGLVASGAWVQARSRGEAPPAKPWLGLTLTLAAAAVSGHPLLRWLALAGATLLAARLLGRGPAGDEWRASTFLVPAAAGLLLALVGLVLLGSAGAPPAAMVLLTVAGYGVLAGIAPFCVWPPGLLRRVPPAVAALVTCGLLNGALFALLRVAGRDADGVPWTVAAVAAGAVALPLLLALSSRSPARLAGLSALQPAATAVFAAAAGVAGPGILHLASHTLARLALLTAFDTLGGEPLPDDLAGLRRRVSARLPGRVALLAAVAAVASLPPFATGLTLFLVVAGASDAGHPRAAGVVLAASGALSTVLALAFGRGAALAAPGPARPAGGWPAVAIPLGLVAGLAAAGLFWSGALAALAEEAAAALLRGEP